MTPHGDTNIETITERFVVLIQDLAAVMNKAQYRRVDDNVVCAAILCVECEIQDRVEILVRNRNDNPGLAVTLIDRNLKIAFPSSRNTRPAYRR